MEENEELIVGNENIRLQSLPKNEINPFLEKDGSIIKVPQKHKRMTYKTSEDDTIIVSKEGEIKGETGTVFIKETLVDNSQFIKVFANNLKQFFKLNSSAIKVLVYLFHSLKVNNDRIIFDMDECKEFTGIKSGNTIFYSLAKLCQSEFIARTKHPNMYFINPLIFFNGERIAFIQSYRKRRAKENQDNEQNTIPFMLESGSDEQPASENS
jgi:hypothetical protein